VLGVADCPTSVFTGTPATLSSPFFKCCSEKGNVEKLSEANAFAGLVTLVAIAGTFVLVFPFNKKLTKAGCAAICSAATATAAAEEEGP
jgi:hypothetical protein